MQCNSGSPLIKLRRATSFFRNVTKTFKHFGSAKQQQSLARRRKTFLVKLKMNEVDKIRQKIADVSF